jgi:hypothetical protein
LVLAVIKYLIVLIGLIYTIYILGSDRKRKGKITLLKARKPFFVTIGLIMLVALIEWIIVIFFI